MQNTPSTQTTQPQQPSTPPKPSPSGKAIATLVLGILAMICCGFATGIAAIIVGKQELNAIKEGRSEPAGYTITQVGFILGIIGTVISCLFIVIYIGVIIFGFSLATLGGMEGASSL
jgi:uncharacterized membrane protein